MKMARRGFFAALASTGGAAAVLANVPEPESVAKISVKADELFVLAYPHPVSSTAREALKRSWESAFDGKAPGMIVLDGGMTISKVETRCRPRFYGDPWVDMAQMQEKLAEGFEVIEVRPSSHFKNKQAFREYLVAMNGGEASAR